MSLLQKRYIKANFLSCIFFVLIGPFTTLIFQEVILISCLSSIGKVKQDQYGTSGKFGDLGGEGECLEAMVMPQPGVLRRGRRLGKGGRDGRGGGGEGRLGELSGGNCLNPQRRNNY